MTIDPLNSLSILGPRAFPEPSREPDVVVLGAGAAGIGAARRLLARGLTVAVIEARPRVGGRAVTAMLRGRAIDLGAHWLHAGPINPLVRLGLERGEVLRKAPVKGHLVIGGRLASPAERDAFDRAFDAADRAMTRAARGPEDLAAGRALPVAGLGPYADRVRGVHGLVSGRPLDAVSLHDFPSMEYADNWFIAGGYGAYLARLAAGLPIRLGAPATRLDWSGEGVTIETAAGSLRARAAVVTAPVRVLQAGRLAFVPALPADTAEAIAGFERGTYEHVVLHWPGAPFRGADRLATLLGTRHRPPGLLTRIEGSPFHYFELDEPAADVLERGGPRAAAAYVRTVLAAHFGHRAIHGLAVPAVSDWRHDPWSLGSWVTVPPGRASIRTALRRPVAERIWFAGEALSQEQWGTAGGAYAEGERAADEVAARLKAK